MDAAHHLFTVSNLGFIYKFVLYNLIDNNKLTTRGLLVVPASW